MQASSEFRRQPISYGDSRDQEQRLAGIDFGASVNQSDDTIGWRREAFDDLSVQVKQNANLLPLADEFQQFHLRNQETAVCRGYALIDVAISGKMDFAGNGFGLARQNTQVSKQIPNAAGKQLQVIRRDPASAESFRVRRWN